MDDWRLYWDPSPAAVKEANIIKTRLHERFSIEFKDTDPETDFFLGSNRVSVDRDVATLKATSYIELQVKRYLGGMDQLDKHPASWGHSPSDPTLLKDWDAAVAKREPASKEFTKDYG